MKRRYPAILHTDDGIGYGVPLPDLPGCFTTGETLDEALASVQEAVEACLFDAEEAPQARPATEVLGTAKAEGGVLAFVEVDLSFLDREPIRVNISVPRNRLERIDAAAKEMGMPRSGFLVQAAEQLIEKR
ncbi:type II toxin-antitoxin system HicB family antitoxin [Solidesulfovibrio sp. C21]|uniref:type II toxin-antitoxin system HicB family antitoxin n=1 Tax=Solidesulfovibrio sp. C21 TaxID=3398613 RepID=UPI0039FD1572